MGSLFVYYQQNGCHFSHLNNISVNIIDFEINTSVESTYMQFCYVLNIFSQFILCRISPNRQKLVSIWRVWWKQWGRMFKFINWLLWNQFQWKKSILPQLITATFHQLWSTGWMTIQLHSSIHASIHLFSHSLIHPSNNSLIHLLTYSLIHSDLKLAIIRSFGCWIHYLFVKMMQI